MNLFTPKRRKISRIKVAGVAIFLCLITGGLIYIWKNNNTFAASSGTQNDCSWALDDNGFMEVYPTNGVSCTLTARSTNYNTAWSWYSQRENIKEFKVSSGVRLGVNLNYMLSGASNLINIDVSNWNTSNVANMSRMFDDVSSLTDIDVSNWNTSNVTNMSYMFRNASSLANIDVSNWNTSNVTNMSGMFSNASSLTDINVSKWNTSNVTDMNSMFDGASSLTNIDMSNWDTSKVTNMRGMFANAKNISRISYGPNFTWKHAHGSLREASSENPFTGKWAILQDGDLSDGTPSGTYATGAQYTVDEIPSNPSSITTIVWHQERPKYSITYSAGDKGTFEDITYTQNLNETTEEPDKSELTSINGYDFIGWDKDIADTVTINTTYTAQWRRRMVSHSMKLTWNDEDNKAKTRPETLSVQLYQNGKPYGEEMKLSEENKWQYELTDLPEYSEDREIKYAYTAELLDSAKGYITTDSNDGDSTVFTNTLKQDNFEDNGGVPINNLNQANNPKTEDNIKDITRILIPAVAVLAGGVIIVAKRR